MFSQSELSVLRKFRQFRIPPGRMLCFYGPDLAKLGNALQRLTKKKMLVREKFRGGYSLTDAGFEAMQTFGRSTEATK